MGFSAKQMWVAGGALALAVGGSAVLAGCSSEHGGGELGQGASDSPTFLEGSVQGELLARVDLTKTHYVEFRALPGGMAGVGILEFGMHGEAPLERAEWDALGPEGVYKSLAKLEAPEALVVASREMREKQFQISDLKTVTEIELPSRLTKVRKKTGPEQAPAAAASEKGEPTKLSVSLPVDRSKSIPTRLNSTSPIKNVGAGASRTADGLGKSTQAVYGDAAWFQSNFCATSLDVDLDSVWCPTNAGSVTGGTRYTMFYNSAGMSAPGGQGANFRVEYYDWGAGAWATAAATPLTPGQWASYTWQGEVTFRSSIAGVNNTAVHFMDKYRRSVTYLTHYTYYPSDVGWDFGNDIQGAVTDGVAWYLSRTEYTFGGDSKWGELARVPIGTPLANEPSYVRSEPTAWRGSFKHYGALTQRGTRLYVPVDGPGGCGVGVFARSDLSTSGVQTLNSSTHCGWLAYNPRDDRFYGPLENQPAEKIFKWNIQLSPPAQSDGLITTQVPISRIAGGAFSPRGVLWVFSGYHQSPMKLYAIDVRNGFVYHRADYPVNGDLNDWEAEGVSVFDLTNGIAPNISGHVHVQLLRNDELSDDNWWFGHLVANDPASL